MRGSWLALVGALASLPSLVTAGEIPRECASRADAEVWTLPVRARSPKFQIEPDLKAADFAVTDHRTPVPICGFMHVRYAVSVGIVLDTSGSMRGRMLDLARAGISQFLDHLGPQDEVFLARANETPAVQSPFTRDFARVRNGLNAATAPRGKTALFDAVYLALNAMRQARYETRVLVVVSDGYENASAYRIEELTRAFGELPVSLFLIVQEAPPNFRPPADAEVRTRRAALMKLADATGGYAVRVSTEREILEAASQLADGVHSVYRLQFQVPAQDKVMVVRVEVKGVTPRPVLSYRTIGH